MASRGLSSSVRGLVSQASRSSIKSNASSDPTLPRLSRTMATETSLPTGHLAQSYANAHITSTTPSLTTAIPSHIASPTVLTTLYEFPTMEPLEFVSYPSNHLYLPLRRDLLHRAVVYEGDKTRQGTANTKWRGEVHGSNRKIRPQKGTGHARLGDKKSPMLKGGGVAFGPKPRDFSTDLPRKMYDLAWRTALSYRYRRGELIVVKPKAELARGAAPILRRIFERHGWGNAAGRSLVVCEEENRNLFEALREAGEQGKALTRKDVDVKDLLEMGRVIIEKNALDQILKAHSSDLVKPKTMVRSAVDEPALEVEEAEEEQRSMV